MTLLSKIRILKRSLPTPARSYVLISRNEHSKPQYSLPPGYSAPAIPDNKRYKEIPPQFLDAYSHGTGLEPNCRPRQMIICDEPHVGPKFELVTWILLLFVIPVLGVWVGYLEYLHLHEPRKPYPRFEWMHQRSKPFPFSWNGDGVHSYWHHPYWNFFKDGYETDKDGNLLPPGTFVPE